MQRILKNQLQSLLFFVLICLFFTACSKEKQEVQHFFKYAFNNKSGGSSGTNKMTLANSYFMDNGFIALTDNGSLVIDASMGADCGSAGQPNCYTATIIVPALSTGTYILGQNAPGSLQLAEFTSSGIEQYNCANYSVADDVITVHITEAGGIGGVVAGNFTGTVGGVSVSGEFKVERLS
jgi:hypothetical protein